MKVLLLSAYAAHSHVHWQQMLQSMFPHWEWTALELPPRHFSWRVRGNALYWSLAEQGTLEQRYDLLIATSMVDLATLRGLVPALARLRTVVYFHENQFEYPQTNQQHSLVDARIASLYTDLAADVLLFNSRYNLDSFMTGCAVLLGKMPDRVPPGIVSILQDKATVLPVPIDGEKYSRVAPSWPGVHRHSEGVPLRLLWVGRFEHDKGGEGLLSILQLLERSGLDFELAVTGQQFRRSPEVFREIECAFRHRLVQFGYVKSANDYRALLRAADIVLSTALHEFQGLAVMEAVVAGCLPVVPDRLGYREIYPVDTRYASHTDDPEREAESAVGLVLHWALKRRSGAATPPDMSAFGLPHLTSLYRQSLLSPGQAQDSH